MPSRAVVVSFDRLHLGYLGSYGNEWIETPNFDALAAAAVTFDLHFAATCDQPSRDHAWWTGSYAFAGREGDRPTPIERLSQAGVKCRLLVESDGTDGSVAAPSFDEVTEVRGEEGAGAAEESMPFAKLVERAIQSLHEVSADRALSLLWIKSRGVPAPWQPPETLADLYLDEFGVGADAGTAAGTMPQDPFAEPEEVWYADSEESTDLKFARALYAAYVTHLDRWFGKLLRELDRTVGGDETLLIVTAALGEPVGEHGEFDTPRDHLREEVVHTPLWVRVPGSDFVATRRPALVQTVDLCPTLLEWFGIATPVSGDASTELARHGQSLLPIVRLERAATRDAVLMMNGEEWGLRTHEFLLIHRGPLQARDGSSPVLLFEKPYDRWDQADVSTQYPQIAERLHARLISSVSELLGPARHGIDATAPEA